MRKGYSLISEACERGYSLVEILVVLTVFAMLAIVSSQALLLTLRGARKSEGSIKVRESLSFAASVMERQLHNASDVSPCPNPDPVILNYRDAGGKAASFSCINVIPGGTEGYVASGSARLTESDVSVTSCFFSCTAASGNQSPAVAVSLTGKTKFSQGVESSEMTTSTQIFLRSF